MITLFFNVTSIYSLYNPYIGILGFAQAEASQEPSGIKQRTGRITVWCSPQTSHVITWSLGETELHLDSYESSQDMSRMIGQQHTPPTVTSAKYCMRLP